MRSSNANLSSRLGRYLAAATLIAGLWAPTAACGQAERPVTMEPPDAAAAQAATEQRVRALSGELAKIASNYGPDSVALQASLLIETMRAGAVGPSEVRVAGPSPREGADYLEIDIGTGLIFDSDTTDLAACNQRVWTRVAAPALGKMERFDIRPAGLELVFTYGVQSYSRQEDRDADPTEPQEAHTVRFVFPAAVLEDLAYRRITVDAALAAGRTGIDDVTPRAADTPTDAPP